MKAQKGSESTDLFFFNFDAKLGLVVKQQAPAALPSGLRSGLSGYQDQSRQVRRISPPPGFDPQCVQPVASRYTDYAIPAHSLFLLPVVSNT
jgi:hypothetical protein